MLLEVHAPATGRVLVVDGEGWAATDRHGDGLAALQRLSVAKGARVTCSALVGDPGPRTLSGSCEWLLLECARLTDEGTQRPSTPDFQACFDAGLTALLARRHHEALEAFRAAHELRPHDANTRVLVTRLEELCERG